MGPAISLHAAGIFRAEKNPVGTSVSFVEFHPAERNVFGDFPGRAMAAGEFNCHRGCALEFIEPLPEIIPIMTENFPHQSKSRSRGKCEMG